MQPSISTLSAFLYHLRAQRGSHFKADWVTTQLRRCDDLEWATRFSRGCPVEGASARDYLQRVVTYSDCDQNSQMAILGIRFLGGDINQPFISVVAEVELDDIDLAAGSTREAALASLQKTFSAYRLQKVIWNPAQVPPDGSTSPDQLLLAREVSIELARRPIQAGSIAVEQLNEASRIQHAAAFVSDTYSRWESLQPWRKGRVFPISTEELHAAAAEGIIFEARLRGEIVGLITASPALEENTGIFGWCISEEVVTPESAGKGLATLMQLRLLSALATRKPGALLYGTIDHDNKSSIAVAQKCGRKILASIDFWPLSSEKDL